MTSARAFSSRLAALLRTERGAAADFLVALADFDRRRCWAELGHASLFSYLHRDLGLSLGAAQYKKTGAELVQRFPEVLEALLDGRLCQTAVCEVARVLTPENRAEVLPRFFGLSRREAAAVAAELAPREAPRRTVVTAVRSAPALAPATVRAPAAPVDATQLLLQPAEVHPERNEPPPPPASVPPARAEVVPYDANLRRVHLTVSKRLLAKLDAARAALSHSHPGATDEEILETGLDLVLERHARRRGIVAKPQAKARPAKPDAVPAHVKRAVWTRDGGKCQWKLDSGGVCGSTLRVEIDHRAAKARGGPPTLENLRCLCRVHNEYAARLAFGDAWMDRYTGRRRKARRARRER